MTQTVKILPQSNDTTLYLRLYETVTLDDYLKYFVEPAKKIADTNGWYNLMVIHDESFKGWTAEAADVSFRYLLEYCPMARQVAYVNATDSRMLLMKMLEPVMKDAEIRFYELSQLDEAIAWMQSYKP